MMLLIAKFAVQTLDVTPKAVANLLTEFSVKKSEKVALTSVQLRVDDETKT